MREALHETGMLVLVLERQSTPYPHVVGTSVRLFEGVSQAAEEESWRGLVRTVTTDGEGNTVLYCYDALAHLDAHTMPMLLYNKLVQKAYIPLDNYLTGPFYPDISAKLPHTDFIRPLRDVRLIDSFANRTTEDINNIFWSEGGPPVSPASFMLAVWITGNTSHRGFRLNFRPNSTAVVSGLQFYANIRHEGAGGIDINYRVHRLDAPTGDPAEGTVPADAESIIWEGNNLRIFGPLNDTWGWFTVPFAIDQLRTLDPNQIYQLQVEWGPTQMVRARIATQLMFPVGTARPWSCAYRRIGGTSAYEWFKDVAVFTRTRVLPAVKDLVEQRDFTIKENAGNQHIVFDRGVYPVWDISPEFLQTIEATYLRGNVAAGAIADLLLLIAGVPVASVPDANLVPAVDTQGTTLAEVVYSIMQQTNQQYLLDRTTWLFARRPLPPIGVAVASFDTGESGDPGVHLIVSHTLAKYTPDVATRQLVTSSTPAEEEIFYMRNDELQTRLNAGGPTAKMVSDNQSNRRFMPLREAILLANTLHDIQQAEEWRGTVTVDGQAMTLRPGDVVNIRIDKLGINDDMRLLAVERSRYTNTLHLSKQPTALYDTLHNIDRRLQNQERTSLPQDFKRTANYYVFAPTPAVNPPYSYTVQQYKDHIWHRLETSTGLPVTDWVRAVDVHDTGVLGLPGWRRDVALEFKASMENTRMPTTWSRVRWKAYGAPTLPLANHVVNYPGGGDTKDFGETVLLHLQHERLV